MKKKRRLKFRLRGTEFKKGNTNWRIKFLGAGIILFGAVLCSRLFFLQVKDFRYFSALARGQQYNFEVLMPPRGNIYMTSKSGEIFPVAMNKRLSLVYAVPNEIKDDENFSRAISQILGQDPTEITQKIKDKDIYYKVLASKVEQEKVSEIKKANLKGVYFTDEISRYYPNGKLASQTIGFLGFQDKKVFGQYGLEKHFENILAGKEGYREGSRDAKGRWVFSAGEKKEPSKKGADLYLTIDYNIQYQAEKILASHCEKWKTEKGLIIVLETETGKIKALANWPNFDPNNYRKEENLDIFRNDAIERVFEPGSVFKLITMASGLDLQKVTPEMTYTDPGKIKFGGYTIENYDGKSHGVRTMTQVLEESLNTGAVFVQQQIGKEKFKEYVEKFDFGKKTEIELPGELSGDIRNLNSTIDINYATASFGQGIDMTPTQFVKAVSAIANRGTIMKPHLIEKKVFADGREEVIQPEILKQVISPESAAYLSAMMVSVVKNGHAKRAQIPGYFVAGKTGTAQIPNVEASGYSDQTIHAFVGFFPAFDPQFLILVKLDKPQGVRFAESSAVPAFKELAQYIIDYYEIPPDYEEEKNQGTPSTQSVLPANTP